jgi:uncharacterized coiled-coil protein SlyX
MVAVEVQNQDTIIRLVTEDKMKNDIADLKTYLEAGFAGTVTDIKKDLREGTDGLIARVEKMDERLAGLETKFTAMDERLAGLETGFTAMDAKMDTGFAELKEMIKKLLK